MARADEMRKLAKRSERNRHRKDENEAENRARQDEAEVARTREWFRSKGRAEYLAEIRKAAKSGEREIRLDVSSSGENGMSAGGRETLKLVEAMLKKEGFKFAPFSQPYNRLSQGEGLPNEVGTEYGFDVSW